MKLLKKVLITLVVIIALAVIAAYFLPRKVKVQRSLAINAPAELVFEQINTLKNWEKWSPWHKLDPSMKLTYEGPGSGQGASYSWESNQENVGKGKLTILASMPFDSIATSMDFMENGVAVGGYKLSQTDSGLVLTWSMESDMGMNPIGRWFGLLMDDMIGADFEKGLASIKQIAESTPAEPKEPEVKVEETTTASQNVLTVKDSATSVAEVTAKLGPAYAEIMEQIGKNGANQVAPVFAMYHHWSKDKIVFEAGIPVDKAIKPDAKSRVKAWEMQGVNAVVADHYGDYSNLEKTHMKIDEYIKKNGKTVTGAPWESYVTDPGKEPDASKWLTKVYYPVQ